MRRWCVLGALFALLVMFAGDAIGATRTSVQDGLFSAATTWDAAVPGAGDTAVIVHYVTSAAAVITTLTTIDVNSGGTCRLIGSSGAITIACIDINVNSGGLLLLPEDTTASLAILPGAGKGNIEIEAGGKFVQNGDILLSDAAGEGNDHIVEVNGATALWEIKGRTLGTGVVYDIADGPSYPRLVVSFTHAADTTASHLQLNSGWMPGAIYEIKSWVSPTQCRLATGAVQFENNITAAVDDSIAVTATELDLFNGPGATFLYTEDGGSLWTNSWNIDAVAPSGRVYIEGTVPAAMGNTDDYMVTAGIAPDTKITFFDAAEVVGRTTFSATSTEAPSILIDGGFDAEWAVFKLLGEEASAANLDGAMNVYANAGTWSFKNSAFFRVSANYYMDFADESSGSIAAVTRTMENIWFADATKTYSGEAGSIVRVTDDDQHDNYTFDGCGARDFGNNFVLASAAGGSFRLINNRVSGGDSLVAAVHKGSFIDLGDSTVTSFSQLEIKENRVFAMGNMGLEFVDGGFAVGGALTIRENKFSVVSNSVNFESQDAEFGHRIGQLKNLMTFEMVSDTTMWSAGNTMYVSGDYARCRDVKLQGCLFANNGGMWRFGDATVALTDAELGSIYLNNVQAVGGTYTVRACEFRDSGRNQHRGFANAANGDLQLEGNTGSARIKVIVDNCRFTSPNEANLQNNDAAYILIGDDDFDVVEISDSYFEGGFAHIRGNAEVPMLMSGNIHRDLKDYDVMVARSTTENVYISVAGEGSVLRYCTFYHAPASPDSLGADPLILADINVVQGNIFYTEMGDAVGQFLSNPNARATWRDNIYVGQSQAFAAGAWTAEMDNDKTGAWAQSNNLFSEGNTLGGNTRTVDLTAVLFEGDTVRLSRWSPAVNHCRSGPFKDAGALAYDGGAVWPRGPRNPDR